MIVFCGVHFMAETAKILSPGKTVLMPDTEAGCPMADMITADRLRALKAEHPGAVVVTYVNTTAEVKAETDVCCTSANAVEIVSRVPADREIIFVPDQHLGDWVVRQTGRAHDPVARLLPHARADPAAGHRGARAASTPAPRSWRTRSARARSSTWPTW